MAWTLPSKIKKILFFLLKITNKISGQHQMHTLQDLEVLDCIELKQISYRISSHLDGGSER